jgi:hypothetical protein
MLGSLTLDVVIFITSDTVRLNSFKNFLQLPFQVGELETDGFAFGRIPGRFTVGLRGFPWYPQANTGLVSF